ncbi:unnamed protein product [Arabidopsis lyrata]|nr:unnamed protein product [Arabidopsis lyrata]
MMKATQEQVVAVTAVFWSSVRFPLAMMLVRSVRVLNGVWRI